MKKLLINISSQINKKTKKEIKSNENKNQLSDEKNDQTSQISGLTNFSNLTFNFSSIPFLAPLKNIYEEFKDCINNKPSFKNKGISNQIYNNVLQDSRKIYYQLLEIIDDFIVYPENQNQLLKVPDTIENDQHDPDVLSLNNQQKITQIDHIKTINTTHKGGIFCIKIIDDDTFLTGSNDKTLQVWQMQSNNFQMVKQITFEHDVSCINILNRNDQSKFILCGLYKSFAVLNQNYDIMKIFEVEHDSLIYQIVGLQDGETVITSSTDPKICCINISQNERVKKYFDHRDSVYSLEIFPSKKFLASTGKDRSIKIWKLFFFKDFKNNCFEKMHVDLNIEEAHKTDITSLKSSVIHPHFLFSGCQNGEIKIWDITDGILLKTFKNYAGWIYKIVLLEQQNFKIINKENKSPDQKKPNNSNFSDKKKIKAIHQRCQTTDFNDKQHEIQKDKFTDIQFLSFSFDGSIKLWSASKSDPISVTKSKNLHDFYPFGGVGAFRNESNNQINFLMSGNKNDKTINIWALK